LPVSNAAIVATKPSIGNRIWWICCRFLCQEPSYCCHCCFLFCFVYEVYVCECCILYATL